MSWRARFTPCVSSITIWLNPKDPACFGVRNWWRINVPEIQLLNPFCRFTVQELSFGEPYMSLYYTALDQRMVRLAGATEDEFEDIMEACITYGMNHVIIERPRTDDGGDLSNQAIINSFGYTESFQSKLEVQVPADIGQSTTFGVDDPGQQPRVYPRNIGYKLMP